MTARTAIVESGYDAFYVTCVDVDIQVQDPRWQARRDLVAEVPRDRHGRCHAGSRLLTAAVAKVSATISRARPKPPSPETEVELDSRNRHDPHPREAAIGNLFADAMRHTMKADAAVINGGGIRSGKVYAPGSEHPASATFWPNFPFNNRVVVVEITGADLLLAMENGLARAPVPAGRFPQVSGIKTRIRSQTSDEEARPLA
jgi:5'-nucleotidase/UDP-sugar diphosphatase